MSGPTQSEKTLNTKQLEQVQKVNAILLQKNSPQDKRLRDLKVLGNKERIEFGSTKFYTDYIDRLDISVDKNCDIKTKYVIDPKTQEETRIRDARDANGKKPEEFYHPWLQNLCTQARAASIIMDIYGIEGPTKKKLEQSVYNIFKKHKEDLKLLKDNDPKTPEKRKELVQNFSYEMIEALKKTLPKKALKGVEIEKLIDQARDFGNFEQTHRNTITLIKAPVKGGNKTIIKSSLKVHPLDEEIKKFYNDLDSQTWFKELKVPEQKLVKKYKDKITKGECVLPTQLRYLPGLKNAYFDVFGTCEGNNVTLQENSKTHFLFQSGTMAYNGGNSSVGDQTAEEITEKNIQYGKTLANEKTGENLHIQVLNSVIGGGDENITPLMNKVAPKLLNNNYEQKGINLFSDTNAPQVIKDIYESVTKKSKNLAIWLQCKSGKDRTNLMVDATQTNILAEDLGCKIDEIKTAMVKSNHAESLASGVGGTVGAWGLKVGGVFKRGKKNEFLNGFVKEHWSNAIADINNTEKPPKIKTLLANFIAPKKKQKNNQKTDDKKEIYTKILEENEGLKKELEEAKKLISKTTQMENRKTRLPNSKENVATKKQGR